MTSGAIETQTVVAAWIGGRKWSIRCKIDRIGRIKGARIASGLSAPADNEERRRSGRARGLRLEVPIEQLLVCVWRYPPFRAVGHEVLEGLRHDQQPANPKADFTCCGVGSHPICSRVYRTAAARFPVGVAAAEVVRDLVRKRNMQAEIEIRHVLDVEDSPV